MADDEDGDDELDALWNPAQQKPSPLAKKPLELVVADGKEAYRAFEAQDTPYRCVVHSRTAGMTTIFSYHQLGDIDCSPTHDFVMFTTNRKFIRIYGSDLQPLVTAMTLHTCKAIHEYDKGKHLAPPNGDGQPFIDRIEVTDFAAERNPRLSKPERETKAEEKPERQEG